MGHSNLLECLFRERLVLGQVVKMFAKLQRWEIMHCMVLLNDLEELVEPPLGGNLSTSTLAPPKDVVMNLDEEDELKEEANEMAQFSPDEANYGLV